MSRWSPTVLPDDDPSHSLLGRIWAGYQAGSAATEGHRQSQFAEAMRQLELRQRGVQRTSDIRGRVAANLNTGTPEAPPLARALASAMPWDAGSGNAGLMAASDAVQRIAGPGLSRMDPADVGLLRATGARGTTPFAQAVGPVQAAPAAAPADEPWLGGVETPATPAAAPPTQNRFASVMGSFDPDQRPSEMRPYTMQVGRTEYTVDPMAEFNRTQQLGEVRGQRILQTMRGAGGKPSPMVAALLASGEPETAMQAMGMEGRLAQSKLVDARYAAQLDYRRESDAVRDQLRRDDQMIRRAALEAQNRNSVLSATARVLVDAAGSLDDALRQADESGSTAEAMAAVRTARTQYQQAQQDYRAALSRAPGVR